MMGSGDHSNQIVKGKRTKRQRSLSLFGVAAVATTDTSGSSSSSGGGELEGGNMDIDCFYNSVSAVSSPTTTTTTSGGELIYESSSTEEEEDMANCLIMLAQGDAPRQQHQQINQESLIKSDKLISSRKFTGVVTTAGGTSTNKAGFYVYECKTCNRSFPSFQALGGHRASHKKPRATAAAAAEDKKSSSMVFPPLKDDFEDAHGSQFNKIITSLPASPSHLQPVSLQTAAAAATKGSKIHECSICGSEFTSGQALGGHMRRHRSGVTTGNNQVVMSVVHTTTIIESNSSAHHEIKPANRSILPLDLNLPAPEDDHLRESKFQFGSSTQPPHSLVFSAPALVDCHY